MANGAELPLDFCGTLLNVIARLRPPKPGAAPVAVASGSKPADVKYPALAVPDNRERMAEMTRELQAAPAAPRAPPACVPAAAAARARRALGAAHCGRRAACGCAGRARTACIRAR